VKQTSHHQLKILVAREQIAEAVARIASEITRDYQKRQPLLICVLKGSFIFMADLVRQLKMDVETDFVQLASYHSGKESSGKVTLTQDLQKSITGRDVLVIEDIVDTGITISFLLAYLKKKRPASLKLCALTEKPSRRKVAVSIDYLGFTLPNKFIVGYGIDLDEKYRCLPDIYSVEG
jgi:hypoxanthine phosphoribosyltransferase